MLRVLQTPVTVAPRATANWTAKVPTPPDAPMTRTRCAGLDPPRGQAEVGGDSSQRQCGGVLERQRLRLARQAALGHDGVLGQRRIVLAQHLVADLPAGDAGPDGFDGAGEVAAADALTRPLAAEDAAVHEPGDPGLAAHDVPVGGVHRRRGDPHEHLLRPPARVGRRLRVEARRTCRRRPAPAPSCVPLACEPAVAGRPSTLVWTAARAQGDAAAGPATGSACGTTPPRLSTAVCRCKPFG